MKMFRTLAALAMIFAGAGAADAAQLIQQPTTVTAPFIIALPGGSFTSQVPITPSGGVGPALATSPPNATGVNSCGAPAIVTTQGTDTTPAATVTYVAEIDVDANEIVTGIAFLNGSVASGNLTGYIADAAGNQIAHTASTAMSGTAAYQRIPLTAAITLLGPGGYFVYEQIDNATGRIRTHAYGNCDAGDFTAGTYGTFPVGVPPTTFTISQGPIAGLY